MIINMKTKEALINKAWVVYILQCKDNTLYTGITNNMKKRFIAHNQGRAAKYTRSRLPVVLSVVSTPMGRTEAMRLEIRIKKMAKEKKVAALNGMLKIKKVFSE